MKQVLGRVNAEVLEKVDLWQNDEVIFKMKSKLGEFELSNNNYDCMFIMAPSNQSAIETLGELFAESTQFEAEEVDFAQYT